MAPRSLADSVHGARMVLLSSFSYPQDRKLRSVHYSHNARGYCLPWLAGLGGEAGCSDQQFVSTPIIILHQESVRASK